MAIGWDRAVALSMGGVPEFDFTTWQRSQHVILDDLGYALKQGDLHHWVKSNNLSVDQIQARTTALIGEVALDLKDTNLLQWSDAGCDPGDGGLRRRDGRTGSGEPPP